MTTYVYPTEKRGWFRKQKAKTLSTGDDDKMFFLSYAQSLCTKTREATWRELLNMRLPAQWRVNGAMMNHPYFDTAFRCDDEDPMNPIRQ